MNIKIYRDLGDAQMRALHALFEKPFYALQFEQALFHYASKSADNYTGGAWALATSLDGTTGFMFPDVQPDKTFNVELSTNYYREPAMDGVTFGAALSLTVINHMANHYEEDSLIKGYYAMREFVFNLAEAPEGSTAIIVNGAAVAGFID